jgi:hypothetical protein
MDATRVTAIDIGNRLGRDATVVTVMCDSGIERSRALGRQ